MTATVPSGGPAQRVRFWTWLLVCLAIVAAMGYLRLFVYRTEIVPLAYTLPMLLALWHRDVRLLWGMAAAFALMTGSKLFVVMPQGGRDSATLTAFGLMQLANIIVPAAVIHSVIRLTTRLERSNTSLEHTNAELETSNEELAAREEEITRQNEELQSQAEELEQQMEELASQTEELQTLNDQLAARERTLDDLLQTSIAEAAEPEILPRLGDMVGRLFGSRVCAVALLEASRSVYTVLPLKGMADAPGTLPRESTLASLVVTRDRAAFLPDCSLRPDLRTPLLAGGARPRSVLAAPVRTGELRGAAFELYSAEPGDWTEHDLRIAQWLADQAGGLLSFVRLRSDIERQRELLRTVTENASAALIMTDDAGHCTYMNPAAERLIGRDPPACHGRTIHDLIHGPGESCGHRPDDCPLIPRGAQAAFAPRDEELLRPSGERIPLVCTTTPVAFGGRVGALVIELRDVREQRRADREREALLDSARAARDELEQANSAKDEFVATLSHELRTPLNAILGWASVLRTSPSASDTAEGLAVIERNARHQAQLISDLLDISRITAGKVRLDFRPVDLTSVAEDAISAVRPGAEARGVEIRASLQPLDRVVVGDADRLQQVIWNLLTNAIKFTPAGGRVELSVSRVASYVELAVSDTGQGIDPALLPHIFERYRQAGDPATRRRHGGLGLGLAIVKNLVDLHGGTVHARSDGPGTGARFSILLPVRAVDRGSPAPTPPRAGRDARDGERPNLVGVRALVVDDEGDARHLIRRVLEDCGAAVVTARTVSEAVDTLERDRPHVLISDIGMPDEDGYELIRRARLLRPNDLPAIALTAFARPQDRARALRAGFQTHISKPVDPAELVAAVATLALPRAADPAT